MYSIAVADKARGLGVGYRLLKQAEALAVKRRCKRMRLEVRQDNSSAIRLYERNGYQRFGDYAHYYEDGMHAWRYEKELTKNHIGVAVNAIRR